MTNREKFEKTFGIKAGLVCPVSEDLCNASRCGECEYNEWWEREFKQKRKPRSSDGTPKRSRRTTTDDGTTTSRSRRTKKSKTTTVQCTEGDES